MNPPDLRVLVSGLSSSPINQPSTPIFPHRSLRPLHRAIQHLDRLSRRVRLDPTIRFLDRRVRNLSLDRAIKHLDRLTGGLQRNLTFRFLDRRVRNPSLDRAIKHLDRLTGGLQRHLTFQFLDRRVRNHSLDRAIKHLDRLTGGLQRNLTFQFLDRRVRNRFLDQVIKHLDRILRRFRPNQAFKHLDRPHKVPSKLTPCSRPSHPVKNLPTVPTISHLLRCLGPVPLLDVVFRPPLRVGQIPPRLLPSRWILQAL